MPDFVERVCTEQWLRLSRQVDGHHGWNVNELQKILQRVARQSNLPVKFCCFIDGLDEYEGDHLNFCQTLRKLANSPYVKVCVSSRPWNVFEDTFGHTPSSKLYIHELTRDDIRAYTLSRLKEHPRWTVLNTETEDAKRLLDQIQNRASGVFLWVFLVTRELRDGLTEYDSLLDLHKRLRNIPSDLEKFFKQILDSVDPFYHDKMASTLQISLTACELVGPAPVAIYSFHDLEYEDEEYALKRPVRTWDDLQTVRRLNGRCRGLLEVNNEDGSVVFIHRTVMDFLKTREMFDYLQRKAAPKFNAELSLLKAFTALIKSPEIWRLDRESGTYYYGLERIKQPFRHVLTYARRLGTTPRVYELLDEVDYFLQEQENGLHLCLNSCLENCDSLMSFRKGTIHAYLIGYINHALSKRPHFFSVLNKPALCHVLYPKAYRFPTSWDESKRTRMLQCLLEGRQDPNETYYSQKKLRMKTPWVDMLDGALGDGQILLPEFRLNFTWYLENGLFSSMLKHGADPNAMFDTSLWPAKFPRPVAAWMGFASVAMFRILDDHFETLYLQVLEDFIEAGADLHGGHMARSGSRIYHQSYLDYLLRWPHPSSALRTEVQENFVGEVVARLISRARATGIDVDAYRPVIEETFSLAVCTKILTKVSYNRLKDTGHSPNAGTLTLKRKVKSGGLGMHSNKRTNPMSIASILG